MQLNLNIQNGQIISKGNAGPIRSLEDARVREQEAAAQARFTQDYSTVTNTLRGLAGLDNGTVAVTSNSRPPQPPQALGLIDTLFSKKAKEEYKQDVARHKADSAAFMVDYEKGGKDLAPEAGVVVTRADENRFGAEAELLFDASGLQQNGDLLTGLQRAQVRFSPSEPIYVYDEFDGGYEKDLAAAAKMWTLNYENTGDNELYKWTTASKDTVSIAIDHKAGVLTYLMEEAPEERIGFMDM